MEFFGANKYTLAGNTSKKSNASFIAQNMLQDRNVNMNNTEANMSHNWANTKTRHFLNTRLKNALPTEWQFLIKQVKVNFKDEHPSTDILTCEDYLYLPSVAELQNLQPTAPCYGEATHIPWYINDYTRIKIRDILLTADNTVHSGTAEPSNPALGDIWADEKNQIVRVLVSKTEKGDAGRYGYTTTQPCNSVSDTAIWVINKGATYWLRSASTQFSGVYYNYDDLYLNNASWGSLDYNKYICLCFSI